MKEKRVQKIVLAGGPCCGKSTLIDEIQKRGYSTLGEVAREVLAEGNFGRGKNYELLQTEILKRQMQKESELIEGLHFLDRSAIDGIAYSQVYLGYLPDSFQQVDFTGRYEMVFLPDRLPLQKDGVRVESDDSEAERIHYAIKKAYLEQGYTPIAVPIFPGTFQESISARTNFIMEKLK